jgi:polysaccharide biosynthesis/export protein
MKTMPSKMQKAWELSEAQVREQWRPMLSALAAMLILLTVGGCQTSNPTAFPAAYFPDEQPLQLREGDILHLSFPGAPDFNTTKKIRPDGKISLPVVGEITAAGKTTSGLQDEISRMYEPHLQVEEVYLTLDSPQVPVYVTGAVLRPGKILTDRTLTALEAVMEAGGFDSNRANIRRVAVIRNEEGQHLRYELNLHDSIRGRNPDPFYLKPNDIIYVPEKLFF